MSSLLFAWSSGAWFACTVTFLAHSDAASAILFAIASIGSAALAWKSHKDAKAAHPLAPAIRRAK